MSKNCSKQSSLLTICGLFLCTVLQTQGSEAQCLRTSGGVTRFGTKCNLRCHCLNATEQCDMTTGACPSGCAYEWAGPGCQYKNIALEEESRNSHTLLLKYSILANDRSVTTCSYTIKATTSNQPAPWWALWYPYDVTFREFEFLTVDSHLKYFPGFIVTVQQGITESDHRRKFYRTGKLCHQHDSRTPHNTTVHVKCIKGLVGNQLRIELANTSTQLVLCDVRVYGGECRDRMWGNTCKNICGLCKDYVQCNVTSGQCPGGCEPGYKHSLSCNSECDDGTYGSNCSLICNGNCRYNICNKRNGTCTQGCNQGYLGEHCDHECLDGFYGYSCRNRCSTNCVDFCTKLDGRCLSCKAGWKGDNCSTECALDEWGKDCYENCGNCWKGSCNKVDGSCMRGCMPGFKFSKMCLERCDTGTYGFYCYQNCSKNCARPYVCDAINGTCACITGWKGKHCDIIVEEAETETFIKLSEGETAGAVVVVILLIVVSILLTAFILRRNNCSGVSRCRNRPENLNVSYVNVAAVSGASANKEAGTEYETIRENKVDEHVYELGQPKE